MSQKNFQTVLDEIWKRQIEFNSNLIDFDSLDMESQISLTKEFILYSIDEHMELARELDWKSFRKERRQDFVKSNVKEELIDIFKYWISLCLIWKLTPEDIIEEFNRKSEVVEQRYRQEWKLAKIDRETPCAIIDIDGVLADYRLGFVTFIQEQTGKLVPVDKITSYEMYDQITEIAKISHEKALDLKHQFRANGYKAKLPLVPGAREFCEKLKENGYQIILMSARPYKKYKRIMADTIYWLKDNSIPYDAILWDEKKDERIVREFPSMAFVVEDSLASASGIASKGKKVYLRDTIYNRVIDPASLPASLIRFETFRELQGILGFR